MQTYSKRAATEHPRELRWHPEPIRYTLVAAFCWTRSQEVTDNLVDLLIQIVHGIGARAERRVDAQLMQDFKRVGGKHNLLYRIASLKERIYSKCVGEEKGPMAGVLIYTSAPDSEGTLGGLVNLGQPTTLGYHIDQALQQMRLCASDPLCAEHTPFTGPTSLHWAACHACLFSPETSCERGNKYLDRPLLVPTVLSGDLAFFQSSARI